MPAHILLLEYNNKKWVGTTVPEEVFVSLFGDDPRSSIAGES
jgi:hypothetical protein